jgi:hypothetical protein
MSWDSTSSSFSHLRKQLGDDDEILGLSLFFALEERNGENDNESRGSLLSFAIEVEQPRTMTSRDFGLLSSLTIKEKM